LSVLNFVINSDLWSRIASSLHL